MSSAQGRLYSTLLVGLGGLTVVILKGCAPTMAGSVGEGANASPTVADASSSPVNASLVFDGVTVVDVEQGKLVSNQRVVIAGNRITAVGPMSMVKIPKIAQVVDARSKYLMPGLWDWHTHSRWYATDFFYPLLIANGVTGIRDAGSEVPLDTLQQWRREVLAGTRVGPPRQIFSGQSINGPRNGCVRTHKMKNICLADSVDARHVVDSFKAAGVDMLKFYNIPEELYAFISAEARRQGLAFGGHTTYTLTQLEASDYGASIIDHAVGTQDCRRKFFFKRHGADPGDSAGDTTFAQCQRNATERFRRNGTWFVMTFSGMEKRGHAIRQHLADRAAAFWAGSPLKGNWLRWAGSPRQVRWLRDSTGAAPALPLDSDSNSYADSLARRKFARIYDAPRFGIPILMGTDAGSPNLDRNPPGFSLHAALTASVMEGLTPLEALQAATLNSAKMLHATDSLGTIAPGKLADLVLLDADPLTDIMNTTTIRAVVANGRYFNRATLDHLLAEVQERARHEPEPFGWARILSRKNND